MTQWVVVMWPLVWILGFLFVNIDAEPTYKLKVTDSVMQCENFKNKFIDLDGLVLGWAKGDDDEDVAKLGGELTTLQEINDDYGIEIDIWKQMDIGDEYMYNMVIPIFCDTIQDTNIPYYPVLQTLNITSCPVEANLFTIDEIKLTLDSMDDVMCHEFCGNYQVHLSFTKGADKVSCHVVELAIVEVE